MTVKHLKRGYILRDDKRTAAPLSYSVEGDGEQLLNFLLTVMKGKSRGDIKAALSHGSVFINGRPMRQFDAQLKSGDMVQVYRGPVRQSELLQKLPVEVIYEDEAILAINKPSGLLTVASEAESVRTVYRIMNEYIRQRDPSTRIFIVHRLDKETSGVLLVAKSQEVQKTLQDNWNTFVLNRGYVAVVEGSITPPQGSIRTFVKETSVHRMYSSNREGDGSEAITTYHTRSTNGVYSLLDIRLETGRKNQIRLHMSEQGCPIVGDKKYGAVTNPLKRLGLHAHLLEILHPVTGKKLLLEAKMPAGFKLGNIKNNGKAAKAKSI